MKSVLVIGNIFESKSLLLNNFCECDSEVFAKKLSSRISGAAIVVSAIAAFLHMKVTIIAKASNNIELARFVLKLNDFGIDTTQIDFSATESNALFSVYDSNENRKCYSYLPSQIQLESLINIDYSIYDAVFFCCLPCTVVSYVFDYNSTINKTLSVILASGLTKDYFCMEKFQLRANYVFCNRGELFEILGEKSDKEKGVSDNQISRIALDNTTLVVTMGKDGVIVVDKNSIHRASVPKIKKVVHPGGAGDAFATGYINGVLERMSIDKCCILGHQCSAQMLSVYSVEEFIESTLGE